MAAFTEGSAEDWPTSSDAYELMHQIGKVSVLFIFQYISNRMSKIMSGGFCCCMACTLYSTRHGGCYKGN